ncbi:MULTISPECIES: siderophore ABC transporter substrate-binding protein [Oligella]|uniref:Ferric anguibactin-binding protein n=2 Tax=Oligella urethralis TaxID=90245 RepID=A0A095Z919_9BURK|nr:MULTISPECIES: siderophore ABC transporter substrate-binding protein [Oligella]AVL72109.1 ferric anguibactin-binding protein [Oligella urethralis]KGF31168.1 ferric anguibactin-binding protein [Oligella urethralis DNF00040]OFV48262.1 ferric anguibactin-binding protein [Oligella sp. HMSC09E12]PMC16874.1 ferric anguibactin-binding protein [Oligella urethralis]WOS36821.1 Ferric-anguibactin-binding protein FatB [Oligella urethralis]
MKPLKNFLLVGLTLLAFTACQPAENDSNTQSSIGKETLTIQHQLGEIKLKSTPQKVAALDMNDVDFLQVLDIPIAAVVSDFVPHFLNSYYKQQKSLDIGAIVQPNIERLYMAKPDLILITPLHSIHYEELSRIAPTLHYDIDYKTSHQHIETINQHLLDLGTIFNRKQQAENLVTTLNTRVSELRKITEQSSKSALVLLHNNGSFNYFGQESRYGFIYNELGVKPAVETEASPSLHGQPISSEFISKHNPDIIFIIDRTAVMERQPELDKYQINNPLIRRTKAWQNEKVIITDADAWYTTAASPTSISIIIDEVRSAYD